MKSFSLAPILTAAVIAVGANVALMAGQSAAPLTLSVLLDVPERHVGQTVDVLIVEPLRGPSTATELARMEYGYVPVDVPDGVGRNVMLAPSSFALGDPNRYKRKFDRLLMSPLRVRGEWMVDKKNGPRDTYVLRVISFESVAPPAPRAISGLAEIDANPAKWDRQRVVYVGTYKYGFEVSALDRSIWLGFRPSTTGMRNTPPAADQRVRVTGYLFAKPGAMYGHMGGYRYMLVADTIEYL